MFLLGILESLRSSWVVRLFLARHAAAGQRIKDPAADKLRHLSPEGVSAATAIAHHMELAYQFPKCVYCSTYNRTIETAQILAEPSGAEVIQTSDLDPDSDLADFVWYKIVEPKVKRALIVGHSEYLQEGIAKLTGVHPKDVIPFVMGEVRLYSVSADSQNWPMVWRIQPSNAGDGFENRL